MTWDSFVWFATPAVALWLLAGIIVWFPLKKRVADIMMPVGIAVFAAFIVLLWISLERPPLRTMGETRLWYSFFLATVGYISYKRWGYGWVLSYSVVVATVFVMVNILKPGIHLKGLMPALQSIWFVPHVTVYILSYALLGAATIAAIVQLVKMGRGKAELKLYDLMDNLVYSGFGLLMLGMLMGAVWAKEAWGNYWSWDPKETWAFATAAAYLGYIHLRLRNISPKFTVWLLPIAFVLLMITWLGVNYLPAAQGSIHVY